MENKIKEKKLRTFQFTYINNDDWAITDTKIVVIAENKRKAIKIVDEHKDRYKWYNTKAGEMEIIELKKGLHLIQEGLTE